LSAHDDRHNIKNRAWILSTKSCEGTVSLQQATFKIMGLTPTQKNPCISGTI